MASRARPLAVVVLAAGEGKRFRSATPKVLHELCGRPMIAAVLDAVAPLRATQTVVVVGRAADAVRDACAAHSSRPPIFAHQPEQRGTGDAAQIGDQALGSFSGDVLILAGDTPLLTTATLRTLVAAHRRNGAAVTILSAEPDDPAGYGRIVRDGDGAVTGIVEHADATAAQRTIREVNTGVYVFDRGALRAALGRIGSANAQGELYLTDVIEILRTGGEPVAAVTAAGARETQGVNSRAQLAQAAAVMRERINAAHMEAGVTIVDPAATYIDASVRIGADTVIWPHTFLSGDTRIGAGCSVGPSVQCSSSRIDDGATVRFAVLDHARVGARASVGPFAYLRPGAVLKEGAKAGTSVEIKGSIVGKGSKVPHLSYVGDAEIGDDVNVGAGTITVNYDAETRTKSRTVVADGAKIGSDTMLIAPVRVGRGAVTAAGSVVTRDVPADTVVAGVPARPLRRRKKQKDAKAGTAKSKKGTS